MIFFITSSETLLTSSIEKAQATRVRMFDSINQPSMIVTLQYNYDHKEAEAKLGVQGRAISIFQYYQQLHFIDDPTDIDRQRVQATFDQPGYKISDDHLTAFGKDGKKRVKVAYYKQRLYSIAYYDRWGFIDRCDFFDYGCLSYTDFYEDRARLVMRQYYDDQGLPVITYYYRGSDKNEPVLTLIRLNQGQQTKLFDTIEEFRAYFFDCLAQQYDHPAFISDRSDFALKAMDLMRSHVKRYQIFHYLFTKDGQEDGPLYDIYKPIQDMLQRGTINGMISSTGKEAADVKQRFATDHSYHIPVTSVSTALLEKQIPFEQRKKGQLIGVARFAPYKRLEHLVNVTIRLHQDLDFVDLKLYGTHDDKDVTANLEKIVKDHNAESYIHFCPYQHDLTQIYETADIEVLTSSAEGFAMVLLEAQSHACPVVSYDVNYGPSDIIEDGVSGKLVPAGDTEALYQTLHSLLTDRQQLRQYSEHAQQVASRFSFAHISQDWQKFLQAEGLWVESK